jgi:hypothetical protein
MSEPIVGTIETTGTVVSCDAWAYQDDASTRYQPQLWFISILGSQLAIRAVWASALKGKELALREDTAQWYRQYTRLPKGEEAKNWRFHTKTMPHESATNGILVPEAARLKSDRRDFLMFPRTAEEAPGLFYRYLNYRLDTPLRPQWAEWLFAWHLENKQLVPLNSQGILAYRCAPREEWLRKALAQNIRLGVLPTKEAA